ncbi:MAG TPA: pilus assembly protein TadG-related protein [Beijerinckiaceae bacterium]
MRPRRFWGDRRGGVVLMLGLAAPILFGGVAAAIDYSSLVSHKGNLQRAADSAALAAVRELNIANATDAQVVNVANVVVASTLRQQADSRLKYTVTPQVIEKRRAVQVSIAATVETWMGRLLNMPIGELSVTAKGRLYGSTRLCVLTLDPDASNALKLDKNAVLTATQCSVYADSKSPQGLVSQDSAMLKAERICTVGGYVGGAGNISPAPVTECPMYVDPLAGRPAPTASSLCSFTALAVEVTRTLMPGTYCGGLKISNGAQVTLMPGTYVITGGPLTVNGGATLKGEDVGFYMKGDQATFDFGPDSTISLSAPKSGTMAGILFFEDRSAPLLRTFQIKSGNARTLLGTFYLSRGTLVIDTNKAVADQSAYTVIVSRQLKLTASPNLVMNAMYANSGVPVPEGVGPNGSAVMLAQ